MNTDNIVPHGDINMLTPPPLSRFVMFASLLPGLLLTIPLGAALGFCGGLFGIGGGIVAIPVLILGFGFDQATAQGTALVMMVPNLLIAWWRYARHNPVNITLAGGVALVGSATTWATAHFANSLDQDMLRALFALFLLYVAWRMLGWKAGRTTQAVPRDRRLLPLVGLVGGSSMGLLGIGGGLVAAPLLTGWFGLTQREAQSYGLALVAPSSVFALATYAQNQRVDWSMGLALAVGGLATVAAGVALAHRWPEHTLRRAFGTMMAATSTWLLIMPWIMS